MSGSVGTDFGCVTSRTLCVKFQFSRVKVCVMVVYVPTEGEVVERERFRNDLDRVVDRVGNGYSLCGVGALNGWVGDRLRVITSSTNVCISTLRWLEAKIEWR